jgi:hypothetical protein
VHRRTWITDDTVVITILNASTASDPIVTRIGTVFFNMLEGGGLKMEENRTLASRTTIPFFITGTWVRDCLCPHTRS